ncbi:hypothetical protein DL93DRAFT_2085011 [Clavulina sp. PMI_390]|nr:hypothetical protein DL93DRAFT_2085011 [Clavulina sp. PMI_390]
MLPSRGHACFQCREHKVRCNALKPVCSRCQRLNKQCTYASDISRRALIIGTLEARALELEMSVHKATLASAHNLSLASLRLLERIKRLGTNHELRPAEPTWLPIYPQFQPSVPNPKSSQGANKSGKVLGNDVIEGYASVISRDNIESQLSLHQWSGLDDLPPSMSRHLIHLFLPYRSHYYFFMDLPYFLHCLSLPSSHPESIHPCLLNACYLAACESSGGVLTSLQPFFIARTRHFLNQSLMYADRITHFLWATVVLACNFGRRRRLREGFAIVSSAALFVSASGRIGVDNPPGERLLPSPKNETEAIDGIRLAYSLYITDQTLTALAATPTTFSYDDRWASPSGQRNIMKMGNSEVCYSTLLEYPIFETRSRAL